MSEEDFQRCRSPAKSPRKRRASKNTMTPALTMTWNRENLSCHLMSSCFFRCCSLKLWALCLGDLLLCFHSAKNRETEAKRIVEEAFHDPPPIVLHWDGKLIQSAAKYRVSEERIAIVLTGKSFVFSVISWCIIQWCDRRRCNHPTGLSCHWISEPKQCQVENPALRHR